jgi:hypothetical protein
VSPTCNAFQIDPAGNNFYISFVKKGERLFMALLLKVNWVDQAEHQNPYLRIRHIGGAAGKFQWKHTHVQAIQFLEQSQFAYYVEKDARALKLEVGCAADGCKFLKTSADGDQPGFLLNLPEPPEHRINSKAA